MFFWPGRFLNVNILTRTGEGNQTRGKTQANHRDKGRQPHLSTRGTIQISMIYIIQIPSTRDGMRKGGNEIIREMIPEENCNTFTNLKGDGRTKKTR